ncbi:MAG: hypothetical protein AAF206_26540 [Bacteroidota bacterium]
MAKKMDQKASQTQQPLQLLRTLTNWGSLFGGLVLAGVFIFQTSMPSPQVQSGQAVVSIRPIKLQGQVFAERDKLDERIRALGEARKDKDLEQLRQLEQEVRLIRDVEDIRLRIQLERGNPSFDEANFQDQLQVKLQRLEALETANFQP